MEEKHCEYCGKPYKPHPRTASFQKACGDMRCQKARQRENYRNWKEGNPEYEASRREKINKWAREYPNYFRQYRKAHPGYVKRDNKRRVEAMKRQRCSAKQITIREVAVGKLLEIKALGEPECSAKQKPICRRIDGVVDFLIWRERGGCSAKQKSMDIVEGVG